MGAKQEDARKRPVAAKHDCIAGCAPRCDFGFDGRGIELAAVAEDEGGVAAAAVAVGRWDGCMGREEVACDVGAVGAVWECLCCGC